MDGVDRSLLPKLLLLRWDKNGTGGRGRGAEEVGLSSRGRRRLRGINMATPLSCEASQPARGGERRDDDRLEGGGAVVMAWHEAYPQFPHRNADRAPRGNDGTTPPRRDVGRGRGLVGWGVLVDR